MLLNKYLNMIFISISLIFINACLYYAYQGYFEQVDVTRVQITDMSDVWVAIHTGIYE